MLHLWSAILKTRALVARQTNVAKDMDLLFLNEASSEKEGPGGPSLSPFHSELNNVCECCALPTATEKRY